METETLIEKLHELGKVVEFHESTYCDGRLINSQRFIIDLRKIKDWYKDNNEFSFSYVEELFELVLRGFVDLGTKSRKYSLGDTPHWWYPLISIDPTDIFVSYEVEV
jgi:hypothetical protein